MQKGRVILEPMKKKKNDKYSDKDEELFEKIEPEELMLELMEIDGVEDVSMIEEDDDGSMKKKIEVLTERNKFGEIFKTLDEMDLNIDRGEIASIAKNKISVSEDLFQKVQELTRELGENDDVQSIWTNLKSK
jgi:transcriptional/translational regulatory protein YebC/TACO1